MNEMDGPGSSSVAPPGVPVYREGTPRKKRSSWRWLLILGFVFGCFFLLFIVLSAILPGSHPIIPTKHIGVIEIEGLIIDSKKFAEELDDFVEERSIAAIVLRINSPGGMIVPSQEMFGAILKARQKKKVFASLGSVAASGGYYVAAAADTILANPGTITGSIGVIMNFVNYEELERWAKLKSYNLKTGPFKDMGSPTRMIREEERKLLQDILDAMLTQFIEDIAKGREGKINQETLRPVADGRIFTGIQAQEIGLVDEIGGYQDAIDFAAKAVGISGKPKVIYPPKERGHFLDYLFQSVLEKSFSRFLGTQDTMFQPFNFMYVLPRTEILNSR